MDRSDHPIGAAILDADGHILKLWAYSTATRAGHTFNLPVEPDHQMRGFWMEVFPGWHYHPVWPGLLRITEGFTAAGKVPLKPGWMVETCLATDRDEVKRVLQRNFQMSLALG